MRKIYLLAIYVCLLLTSTNIFGQKNYFQDVAESSIKIGGAKKVISPLKSRTFKFDVSELKSFLWNLPREATISNKRNAPVLVLPMPDGRNASFRVWESSIQEPGLEAKFPSIRTFKGQGIDDSYATIRFDFTDFGFHAQVRSSANGGFYIDPYADGLMDYYMSYTASDLPPKARMICGFDPKAPENVAARLANQGNNEGNAAGPCRGTELFTYRLAVACTGEYAIAVGGTTPALLHSKIVTTVNRVVGVYEDEVAIRLILVANNNLVEFMDPQTDPFNGNDNGGTLINESNTQINSKIGSANYDIGHTFSTGGGGLAQLGCVCTTSKGRGITGSPNPTGDAYDIDYVAHEMGHQFGGEHTFNSEIGSCGGGNRESTASYEPGSGTTIMAYAGICGADNIQNHSDPHFNSYSFDQISRFVTTGSGKNCKQTIATGNALPVISTIGNSGLSIPVKTPFALTGAATDADADAITYCWEERDLGPTTTWGAGKDNATSPIFKSRVPKTTGTRIFPDMAIILANYPANPGATMGGNKGEVLSNVARTMKFRLTVRDNNAAGGGVVSAGEGCQTGFAANFTVNVVGPDPFLVTFPNGGNNFPSGSTQTITWDNAATDLAPFNTPNVKITLSTDGGQTYPHLITASTPNDGTEALAFPAVPATTQARIKIEAVDNIFFDISNSNFTLTAPVGQSFTLVPPTGAISLACPVPNSFTATIGSTQNGGLTTPIALTATGNPAGTTVSFNPNPLTPGSNTTMTVSGTSTLAAGNFTITINGTAGALTASTTVSFTVGGGTGPAITSQPTNNSACAGESASFTVASSTSGVTYQWQSSTDGVNFSNIAGATSATYVATSITTAMNNTRYRVIVTGQCGTTTSNVATLTVIGTAMINTQPANVTICAGTNAQFSATATGANLSYQWQQSTTGCGGTFTNIAGATNASYTITAAPASLNNYAFRVIISSSCNTLTSNCATLTVTNSVNITNQPTNNTVCVGESASFTTVAAGNNLTYQWQISTNNGTTWTNIAGATAATYSVANVTAAMAGNQFRVVITSSCGSANTNAATLNVTPSASITTQPSATSVCLNGNATFTVAATGPSLTYQWQYQNSAGVWTNWTTGSTGATTTTLTIPASAANNGINVRAVVSSSCGNINSNAAQLTVVSAATITTQPSNTSTCEGSSASYTVAATGANLTYQWQQSTTGCGGTFANIAGATTATYTQNSVTAAMANYAYRVIVSSTCGASITSSCATLGISNATSISTQPANTAVCLGQTATFTTAASGNNLTYQWQISTNNGTTWTNIAGATAASYAVSNVTATMAGNQFRAVVTSTCGSTNSNAATLSITPNAAITTQPAAASVCLGANATFTVAATGPSLTYQWQFQNQAGVWTDWPASTPGVNTSTLTITTVNTYDGLNVRVVVGSTCGAVNSNPAQINIVSAAAITTQPSSTSTCEGSSASYTVAATGANLTYQWQQSTTGCAGTFANISGATSATYTQNNVTAAMANYAYRVIVSSTCGASITSSCATLGISNATSIGTQPTDATVCPGQSATFTAAATGNSLTYQWQQSTDGTTWSNIAGATNASYTIANVTSSMSGNKFRVVATSTCGATNSNAATLTVNASVNVTAQPASLARCEGGAASFSVTATGANSYQWQISTDGGTTWADIATATTSTYSIASVTNAMNNNKFRVVMNTTNCGNVNSDVATLTIGSNLSVTIAQEPAPNNMVTLSATTTPPGTYTYQWFHGSNLLTGATANISVRADSLGDYKAVALDPVTNCSATSNTITLSQVPVVGLGIKPSPNYGLFTVTFYNGTGNAVARGVNVHDSKGAKVFAKRYTVTGAYEPLAVDITKYPAGTYYVSLTDANGKVIATGKVMKK